VPPTLVGTAIADGRSRHLDSTTAVLVMCMLIALGGALAGTAGFSMLVVRRQNRRLAGLAERLTEAQDEGALVAFDARKLRDDRLRAAFQTLADRVADTWRLATIDPLTGIANRQAVLDLVEQELARAMRFRHPLSVILVDLDHFKRLNDSHGHAAGDRVLRHVGSLLTASVRAIDTAGRYGGEEFLIVLPETDVDAAASVAEKLRRMVAGSPLRLESGEIVTVTLSAGVAGGLGTVLRPDVLVRDADAALYSAKALGRDQVYVFRETGDDGTVRRSPINPAARNRAVDVGREAMAAAQEALLRTLAAQPSWAGKPSTLIAEASVALAKAIYLPAGELERIRTASLLHDLGKLAIPEEILAKPGDLVASEWRVVAEHPKIGQVVLEQAGALRDAATIVLHHHEWYDGRGYPHGLAGGEIPIGARIVSIVDAYEAMVAGRPYRAPIPHEAAIHELRRQAGVQFDPELVEVFAVIFEHGVPWTADDHAEAHDHEHDHGTGRRGGSVGECRSAPESGSHEDHRRAARFGPRASTPGGLISGAGVARARGCPPRTGGTGRNGKAPQPIGVGSPRTGQRKSAAASRTSVISPASTSSWSSLQLVTSPEASPVPVHVAR
jgi:diguanylate cyclase (GGDEF)-like protein